MILYYQKVRNVIENNLHKYGILHFKGNITSSLTQSIDTKIFGEIFFLDILYTFSKNNTEDKNLIVGQAYYIYNRYNISSYLNNLIYYDNRSLVESFPEKDKRWNNIKIGVFEGINQF